MNFSTCLRSLLISTAIGTMLPAAENDAGSPTTPCVLIEAESFRQLGGWVIDQQFMDQMGSPFLLAHGLGAPVADAVTEVKFPAPGTYRVWVRTRDWVATWKVAGAPGRFQVLLDGKPLAREFGTEGALWHWQDGGTVTVARSEATVALHDLTGFEGRCDALFFTTDGSFTPPAAGKELAQLRRKLLNIPEKPAAAGEFDLVVVGGGIAGMCAALSAARLGVSVALVHDRPVLGGNNSSEVRVWLGGETNKPPYPHIGDIVKELEPRRKGHPGTADMYEDDKRLELVRSEKTLTLVLNCRVNDVEMESGRIRAVVGQDIANGRRSRFVGRWFADCTGDGTVGFQAGANHQTTERGHMGMSNLWLPVDTKTPVSFPRCPWAWDLSDKKFPSKLADLGQWFWESGFDLNPIEHDERARDNNFRAMYGAWDALKNVRKEYPNHKLTWAAYVAGKRESRRLLGDLILTEDDLIHGMKYPDGCVPTSWSIDLHLANPRFSKGFEEDPFLSYVSSHFQAYPRPYWVPYRCLYSRNVPNLFMAGRNISVTHEALGTVRVMRTTGMMGEIVGMAASICKTHGADPRAVYQTYLEELKTLMLRGAGRPKDAAR